MLDRYGYMQIFFLLGLYSENNIAFNFAQTGIFFVISASDERKFKLNRE
jgi:hypothetical protein